MKQNNQATKAFRNKVSGTVRAREQSRWRESCAQLQVADKTVLQGKNSPISTQEMNLGAATCPVNTRVMAVLISLVLLIGIGALVGCSSETTDKDSSPDSPPAASPSSEASADTVSADTTGMDFTYSNRDQDASYDDALATHITLSDSTASVSGEGAAVQGSTVTITEEGTYVIAGQLSDGQVIVETADDVKVQLVLAGANIHNEDGPAISIVEADKCFITLAEGTENTLSDGSTYVLEEGEDEPNATLYSKADLCLNGTGQLFVNATYQHAVNSKDDLIITGGDYTITATEDALRGKDCVKIGGGTFSIDAGGDGVKSSNDEDSTRGFVSITGGVFDITAGDDGVQAVTLVRIADGDITVEATDDALHSDVEALIADGTLEIQAGDDAVHAETVLTVEGGTVNVISSYEGYEAEKIYINGGETHIVASDDAINASTAAAVVSGDDAANNATDNAVNAPAPEGANDAANAPAPEGANDAANAPAPEGANDAANAFVRDTAHESTNENMQNGGKPMTGMMEGGMGVSNSDCVIEINGGYTVVDAGGDGVDSNGSFAMSDGVLLVCGPTNSGNGAFDYDIEATISGGTFVMVGSTGMAQNFSSGTQAFSFNTVNGQGGQSVAVSDASGRVIASFTPSKSFGMALVSSPAMTEGGSYSLVVGGVVSDANADGYTDSGTVSGGSSTSITASTTATGGMGGLGADGAGMDPGMKGQGQRGGRMM